MCRRIRKEIPSTQKILTDNLVLRPSNFKIEFIVQADVSNSGMGIVLSHENEKDEEHPILCLSKDFSEVEKQCSRTEREYENIVFEIKKLHYY